MTDLWGEIPDKPIKTPVSILREQGSILEKKTTGILTVSIPTSRNGERDGYFTHQFIINTPSLNYNYLLFYIYHPITLFPVTFVDNETFSDSGGSKVANNEEEFLEILGQILQSPKTQNILHSLLSQSAVVTV